MLLCIYRFPLGLIFFLPEGLSKESLNAKAFFFFQAAFTLFLFFVLFMAVSALGSVLIDLSHGSYFSASYMLLIFYWMADIGNFI
jgi:hypothetical protein